MKINDILFDLILFFLGIIASTFGVLLPKKQQQKIIFAISGGIVILISLFMIGSAVYGWGYSAGVESLYTREPLYIKTNTLQPQNTKTEVVSYESVTKTNVPTPIPEKLPDEPVYVPDSIIYDGWALSVSQDIESRQISGVTTLEIDYIIHNMGSSTRIFRYRPSGISVKDNLGNTYEHLYSLCVEDISELNLLTNLEVKAGQSRKMDPITLMTTTCKSSGISFYGVPPLEAEYLIIRFDDFGPFSGVEFILEL